jgi:hypothetical protein
MGVFSRAIEWTGEDYMRLEDNGTTIITRQTYKDLSAPSGQTGVQFLVGKRSGDDDPRKHHQLGPKR